MAFTSNSTAWRTWVPSWSVTSAWESTDSASRASGVSPGVAPMKRRAPSIEKSESSRPGSEANSEARQVPQPVGMSGRAWTRVR